jgi:hypothetical protein
LVNAAIIDQKRQKTNTPTAAVRGGMGVVTGHHFPNSPTLPTMPVHH